MHSTQSKTIGSREWFISGRMLTSKEESVGLFKVVHGDLFGDVSVMGPVSQESLKTPKSEN
mgnify:CR=1 FL=1